MNINELTLGQAKELANLFTNKEVSKEHPFQIGKNYFIRTVTMIQIGKLTAVYDTELVIVDAVWVADTGRFTDAFKDIENLNEVELFPKGDVIIGRGSIIDACLWNNKIPEVQK